MSTAVRPVVVGTDGSSGALAAVTWAALEADLHEVPLRIVHAFTWQLPTIPPLTWEVAAEGAPRALAELVTSEAEKAARAAAPAVPISTAIVTDQPLSLLVNESSRASLVVVGVSGFGPVADMLAGSMTVGLVARSHAPVAVVRGTAAPERTSRPVVVGVDGSSLSTDVVEVGAREAAVRGCRLLVTHVRRPGPGARVRARLRGTPSGHKAIRQAVAGCRRRHPEVAIEERVLTGHPAGVLLDLSQQASLVVVGTRGRGGFTGMVVGSVSQALLHHAGCPVIVVPRGLERRHLIETVNDES
ncbi:universal stress protein [Thermasporomyces composti]|jgi:nucleotide-binding universal stress UspA family protein|uniref:Nucleotide-binding universal stress UspA family protein n=1 Tax=Thermasporomyces composti TaxID=696763 RepID=A0A3D9UZZ9_THECX|nr:universal stress protein [Thermasporomyces composti]REF34847.1 nucleotide-binding universal stress UspA family protein [Thermasporomyces composti]